MLDVLRGLSAALWMVVFVATIGSATRNQFGNGKERDPAWTLTFFYAFLQLGWGLRFVFGYATDIGPGPSYDTTCALNLFSILVAAGVLMKRWQYEGWRL